MPDHAASSVVDAPLRAIKTILEEAHRDAQTRLVSCADTLQDTLHAAASAHDEAAHHLRNADLTDRIALQKALATYRATTVQSVIDPVSTTLRSLHIGDQLVEERTVWNDIRDVLPRTVPNELSRPEPDDLFEYTSDDSVWARFGKLIMRTLRQVQAQVGASPPAQIIRLGALTKQWTPHLMAPLHNTTLHAAEQTVARSMARVEKALSDWMHAVLTAEGVVHAPVAPEEDNAVDASSIEDALHPVWEQVEQLHTVLSASWVSDLQEVFEDLDTQTAHALDVLRSAFQRSGAVGAPRISPPSRSDQRTYREQAERASHWPDWFDHLDERLQFLSHLSALRDTVTETQEALETAVAINNVGVLQSLLTDGIHALRSVQDDVDAMLQPPDPGEERALVQRFARLRHTATDALRQHVLDPLETFTPRHAAHAAVDTQITRLRTAADAQPDAFTVHPPSDDAPIDPTTTAHLIPWADITDDAFGTLLLDAWKAALPPLLSSLREEIHSIEDVEMILQFNLGAAQEELEDHAVARQRGGDGSQHLSDARELALDGLARCIQTLDTVSSRLTPLLDPFVRTTEAASTEAWSHIHDRAHAAGGTRAQVLRAQSWLTRQVRHLAEAAHVRVRGLSIWGQRTAQQGSRVVNTLIRKGRTAVAGTVDEASVRETIEALSTVEAILEDLPLVYRRLFSFRPVIDPALLMGRDEDLSMIERHIEHWRGGLNNALVIIGPAGSGRTSLLNVLRATHLRTADRYTLDLDRRIRDEAALSATIAEALNLPTDAPPRTLDAVADAILSDWSLDTFRVGLIENVEHLFLRTIGGSDLGARFLQFLSSTDSRVLWIATCSTAGWQTLSTTLPDAVSLVDHHPLDPLDRDELESLVMRRHSRSGLPITFAPPSDTDAPLFARRLRQTDDEDERQSMLRDDYFSRLHDLCGQNVMLALFYWFRSLHLEDDHLYVDPLRPIHFDMLDRFSWTQSFALKALLEHATLTVEELAEVAQLSIADSHAVLESLGNALLITPVDGLYSPGVFRFITVERGVRYRIRPLVIHPVTRHLRSRNIVH